MNPDDAKHLSSSTPVSNSISPEDCHKLSTIWALAGTARKWLTVAKASQGETATCIAATNVVNTLKLAEPLFDNLPGDLSGPPWRILLSASVDATALLREKYSMTL